jgi:hypothetical protein
MSPEQKGVVKQAILWHMKKMHHMRMRMMHGHHHGHGGEHGDWGHGEHKHGDGPQGKDD